jgi:hypothetical protein
METVSILTVYLQMLTSSKSDINNSDFYRTHGSRFDKDFVPSRFVLI